MQRYIGREGVYRMVRNGLWINGIVISVGIWEIRKVGWTVTIEIKEWWTNRIEIKYDEISMLVVWMVTLITIIVIKYSKEYLEGDPMERNYYGKIALFYWSMVGLVIGTELVTVFIHWELVGIASYLLINYWFTRQASNVSAMQAVIVNRIGDWGLMIAIVVLLGNNDSIRYSIVQHQESMMSLVLAMITIACIAKSAQIPLGTWLPSAMEAPTPVSALLRSSTMVIVGVYTLIRWPFVGNEYIVLILIAVLTSIISGLRGIGEYDIKKVIAYSTASQLGYMFTAIGGKEIALALNRLVNHAFFKAFLFINAGYIIHKSRDEQDMRNIKIGESRLLRIAFITASFSLIAIPYWSGFYSKDLILENLGNNVYLSGRFIYFLQLLTALLTAIYSIRTYILIWHPDCNRYVEEKEKWTISIGLSILSLMSGYWITEYIKSDRIWERSGIVKYGQGIVDENEVIYTSIIIIIIGILVGKIDVRKLIFNWDHVYNNNFTLNLLKLSLNTHKWIDKGIMEQWGYTGISKIWKRICINTSIKGTIWIGLLSLPVVLALF